MLIVFFLSQAQKLLIEHNTKVNKYHTELGSGNRISKIYNIFCFIVLVAREQAFYRKTALNMQIIQKQAITCDRIGVCNGKGLLLICRHRY